VASSVEVLTTTQPIENAAAMWRARGTELSQTFKRLQWNVADWINDGIELLYPEQDTPGVTKALAESNDSQEAQDRLQAAMNAMQSARYSARLVYDLAEELFPQYSRSTLRTLAHVGRSFPAYMRIYANLTFSHYMAALVVTAQKRAEWLAKADTARPRWPVARLRAEIYSALESSIATPGAEQDSTESDTTPPQAKKRKLPKWDLPLSSSSKERLKALALVRRVDPAILAANIVDSYLADCAEEIQGQADFDSNRRCEFWKQMTPPRILRPPDLSERT